MNKKLNQKKNKRPSGAGAVAPASSFDNRRSVYDGQEFAGYLLPIGKAFQAYDSDDRLVGTYPTLKSASDAVFAKEPRRG